MDPFIGEIKMFAGNFAPRGWALCDGQLLTVSQNDALFSLFGTIYGGDGRTTFGLPDLRGSVAVHGLGGPTTLTGEHDPGTVRQHKALGRTASYERPTRHCQPCRCQPADVCASCS